MNEIKRPFVNLMLNEEVINALKEYADYVKDQYFAVIEARRNKSKQYFKGVKDKTIDTYLKCQYPVTVAQGQI